MVLGLDVTDEVQYLSGKLVREHLCLSVNLLGDRHG